MRLDGREGSNSQIASVVSVVAICVIRDMTSSIARWRTCTKQERRWEEVENVYIPCWSSINSMLLHMVSLLVVLSAVMQNSYETGMLVSTSFKGIRY